MVFDKFRFVGATFGRPLNQNKPDKGYFVGDGVIPLQIAISFRLHSSRPILIYTGERYETRYIKTKRKKLECIG